MFKKMFSFVTAALLAIVSAGCAGPATTYDPPEIRQGVVEQMLSLEAGDLLTVARFARVRSV